MPCQDRPTTQFDKYIIMVRAIFPAGIRCTAPGSGQAGLLARNKASLFAVLVCLYANLSFPPIAQAAVAFQIVSAEVSDFSEDLALVAVDHHYGFLDRSGRIAIKPAFDHAESF
jgi:hypothetical protein